MYISFLVCMCTKAPFTLCFLGIKLRLSGLTASTLTCWAILLPCLLVFLPQDNSTQHTVTSASFPYY